MMRISQIDKITDLREGTSIEAVKRLDPSEYYLQDHFPNFPVMPGVFMLEAMYQASAWLIRKSEDFAHSVVLLKEARNVKYANFVQPGQELVVTAEITRQDEQTTALKAKGTIDGELAMSARLVLDRFNQADRYPEQASNDDYTRRSMREMFQQIYQPASS